MSELRDPQDPGTRPPRPDELPRPALWPEPRPGEQPRPFDGLAEEPKSGGGPHGMGGAWVAVAVMIAGAVLIAIAIVLVNLWWAVAGIVVGLAGAGLAVRSRILSDVTLGQHPGGR